MTANTVPTADELNGVKQDTVQWPAKAHRVTQIDSDGDEITDINPFNVTLPDQIKDVDDNGIAHSQILPSEIALNYGFDNTMDFWMRFLTEEDNGSIPAGQNPQLVINLPYFYSDKSQAWVRWEGDSDTGSMWTTVIGLYTPTFDSILNDTLDTMKVSNDTAINLKVDGSDVTQPISAVSLPLPTGAATEAKQLADNHNVTVSNMIPAVETGLATSALQLPDDHNVTVSNMIPAVETGLATSDNQGKWYGAVSGLTTWKEINGKPRVASTPYGYDVAEGNIAGHTVFLKIGYNPVITDVEEDIWSKGGSYAFLKGESTLQIVSDDNTQDIGSVLFNSTSTGGSTTTLEDSGVDFTAGANPVAVFDCVILDKAGSIPEWGYVTGVTANTLTIAGGFSSGGTGDTRVYIVLNRTAYTGAQAVHIHYLDGDYVEHEEIVLLNGTTAVNTTNSDYWRVNSMDVIAAGTLEASLGNLSLKDVGSAPVYAYITAGYTTARQAVYTVPAEKTLYLTSWRAAWCSPNESKVQSARVMIRINMNAEHEFRTGSLFYPFAEVQTTNEQITVESDIPLKVPATMDIKISAIATNVAGSGPATTVLRGWLEDN